MAKYMGYIAEKSIRITETKSSALSTRPVRVVSMQDLYEAVTVIGMVAEKLASGDSEGSYTISVAIASPNQVRRITAFKTDLIEQLRALKPGTVMSARGNTLIANQGGANSLALEFFKVVSEPEGKAEAEPSAQAESSNGQPDIEASN